jgi:hypothetical protein
MPSNSAHTPAENGISAGQAWCGALPCWRLAIGIRCMASDLTLIALGREFAQR